MEKYIIVEGSEPERIDYEYEVGEILNYNSVDKIKCVKKEKKDGKLYQHFVLGRITFTF